MDSLQFKLNVLVVSYQKADAGLRSLFSLNINQQQQLLQAASELGLSDLIVISTCNRTELISSADKEILIELLLDHCQGNQEQLNSLQLFYQQQQAVYHLFKMGTGLDSQILGDREIVGQLRDAFALSQEFGLVNPITSRLITQVIHASRAIKNQTNISSGTTSVSYAAVEFLKNIDFNPQELKLLVLGIGNMGSKTAVNLIDNFDFAEISLANRNDLKAQVLSQQLGLSHIIWQDLTQQLALQDIIVVATSGDQVIIKKPHLESLKPGTMILDLSLPSNVAREVLEMPHLRYVDIDQLSLITNSTLENRKRELPKAMEIIAQATHHWYQWLDSKQYATAAQYYKDFVAQVQSAELEYQLRKNPDYPSDELAMLMERISNRVATQMVNFLKGNPEQAPDAVALIKQIFKNESN